MTGRPLPKGGIQPKTSNIKGPDRLSTDVEFDEEDEEAMRMRLNT